MVVTAVAMPAWVMCVFGLIQVRACAPSWAGPHLALMRPVASCTSGYAFDGAAVTLVGTVTLATVLAWAAGAGSMAWIGALLARCAARVAGLLRPLRTQVDTPSPVALPSRAALARPVPAREARLPRWLSVAVVGWRAPPVAA